MEFDRNALVSELENLPADTTTVAEKSQNKPDPEPEPEVETKDETPVEDEESAEDVPEDEPDKEEVKAEEDEEEQLDPKTAKALEIRQREEKRAKQAHQARMAEAREYETQLRNMAKEIQAEKARIDSYRSKAMSDPVGVLRELGIPEEMYEYVSKQFYLLSKKGMENPKARELADRERRSRDAESRLELAMKKIEEFEQREQDRLASVERQAVVSKYLDDVQKAVAAEHKLVKKWMEKAPQKFRQRLYETANDLANELGYAPEPDEVLNALETARRAELEELGISVPSDESTTPTADKKKRVTLSSDMGATRNPPNKGQVKSRDQEIDDVRAALERGQFD
jgi:hypothetical protein